MRSRPVDASDAALQPELSQISRLIWPARTVAACAVSETAANRTTPYVIMSVAKGG
jgi:hypothetical protein